MARRSNPTLIGAFVLAAFLLLTLGLLMLGGGGWFTEKRRFVIYFDESIKGLSVGAPVTFKGVVIGRVANLQVHYLRETGKTEIPVLIDLDPGKVVTRDHNAKDDDAKNEASLLREMIAGGLRAQLNPESLITNQQVVQLDFFPGTPARLVDSSLPYPQIPSLPSAFDQLQASLGMAAQGLPEATAAATRMLNQLSALLTPDNQQRVAHILDHIDQLTGQLAAHGDDLGQTLAALQQASQRLNHLLAGLDQVIDANRQPLGEAVTEIDRTAQSLHQLSDSLTLLVSEARPGLRDFSNGSLYDLAGLIGDSRTLVRRANVTLDQLNRDPARFLFGAPEPGVQVK